MKSISHKGNYKIMIVEDNEINRIYFSIVIKKLLPNVSIFEAKSGEDAIKLVAENSFDIIFLDIFLSKMNGFEVAKYIRQNLNLTEIPIIALSSLGSEEDIKLSVDSGITDFLHKPASKEAISNTFEKYILKKNNIFLQNDKKNQNNQKKHFNKEELIVKVGNDADLIDMLLNSFFSSLSTSIEEIRIAITKNDHTLFISTIHHIKGGSVSICFEIISDLFEQLEKIKFDEKEKLSSCINAIVKEDKYLKLNLLNA